ncbi:MAG: hypothetical protein QXU92_01525 [Candidatus Diapherotrites archaeon]
MCAKTNRVLSSRARKVGPEFQPSPVVSVVDGLLAVRSNRREKAELGFYKGFALGSLPGLFLGESLKKDSLRIPVAISFMVLGGAVNYFREKLKSKKEVYAQTLLVAKKLNEFYESEVKGKLERAMNDNISLVKYFRNEDDIYAALAIKLLVNGWNYIYVNRKGELVGSNWKVSRYAISTKKIRNNYYLTSKSL